MVGGFVGSIYDLLTQSLRCLRAHPNIVWVRACARCNEPIPSNIRRINAPDPLEGVFEYIP